jgi:hypothetical protein
LVGSVEAKGVQLRNEMLWGFVFIAESEATLLPLIPLLEAGGYDYVMIFGEEAQRYLHVQRVERTIQAALYARLQQLSAFEEEHHVEFDGWDVGNVDGSVLYR